MSEKGYDSLLGRLYFTGSDGHQDFLVFAVIFNSLILGSNKKIINRILTGISYENVKPFVTNLELTMFNLANDRVILNFNNSVLVQKSSSSMYSNFLF